MFSRHRHFTLLWITLAAAVASIALIPRIEVNSDMTRYLPDSSAMKQGLDALAEEFGSAQMGGADVRVMFDGLDAAMTEQTALQLTEIPEVEGIASTAASADGRYTLFELSVPKSVDQKALGKEIAAGFGKDVIIETSQDGNTPPLSVIIIAAAMIVVLLVLMSGSWLDPLLLLISAGMAIAINMGTNALLPSVSITTNYIGAILQLVLSLDYSIVLLNRYRQEKSASTSGANLKGSSVAPLDAVNAAIPKAFPSIFSSALTTVTGLLMLVFMKLKIGADMGIVLAKGVICSLLCTFSALPSIILILHRAIESTDKKGFIIPTGRISRFCSRSRLPLAAFFILLFVLSLHFHSRTEISFATNGESQIDKIFPRQNTLILLYDNADEDRIAALADSISGVDGVSEVLSLPTVLKARHSAEEMISAAETSGRMQMPSAELLRLVFYMKNAPEGELKIGFPELAAFISGHCLESPLLEGRMDSRTREKISLLAAITGQEAASVSKAQDASAEASAELPSAGTPVPELDMAQAGQHQKPPVKQREKTQAKAPESSAPESEDILVSEFMPRLHAFRPNFNTEVLKTISNVPQLRKRMTVKEMSDFIGSTPAQTKMVYSFGKTSDKLMTPLEYVHLLSDDLFNRKVISSMVSAEQKSGLRARMRVMDLSDAGAWLSPSEMAALVSDFGESWISEDAVRKIACGQERTEKQEKQERQEAALSTASAQAPAQEDSTAVTTDAITDSVTVAPAQRDSAAIAAPALPEKPVRPRRSRAEIQAEMLERMLHSGKTYTAAQMTRNIAVLGERIDPALMELLYLYYGSVKLYDESWTMSLEELMSFADDGILSDPRFEGMVDEGMRRGMEEAKEAMDEGLARMRGPRHSIAVIQTALPDESARTHAALDKIQELCDDSLPGGHCLIGESVMFNEMRKGFRREMQLVTWLTVLAIFLIVAISFRSLIVPAILVMTVMCAVFVNIIFSGIFSGSMLYLAYLITQSILMGATIDYGILFANYYKEKRKTMGVDESIREAYRGSIHTIMTSGLIMVFAPGVMAICVKDVTISAIVGSISIGAAVAVVLILTVLPGLLAAFDRLVVHGKVFRSGQASD